MKEALDYAAGSNLQEKKESVRTCVCIHALFIFATAVCTGREGKRERGPLTAGGNKGRGEFATLFSLSLSLSLSLLSLSLSLFSEKEESAARCAKDLCLSHSAYLSLFLHTFHDKGHSFE